MLKGLYITNFENQQRKNSLFLDMLNNPNVVKSLDKYYTANSVWVII